MDYAIEKLKEERELLNKDLKFEKGWEVTEIKQRIREVDDALLILNSSSLHVKDKEETDFEDYGRGMTSKECSNYDPPNDKLRGFRS